MPRPVCAPAALLLFCLPLACHLALAQQNPAPQAPASQAKAVPVHKEEVVVTGTYEPVAISDVDRDVTVINLRKSQTGYSSLVDALRSDPALDLQQRGPGGVQADLSIRGSSFGQTLVLVNGLRMNDAQTGHHNLDLPLPLPSVERIEVLHGSGSTMYGSDAMGGVVNFITAPPLATELRLGSAAGNFGINQQYGSAAVAARRWTEQLSLSRDFSSGFMADRDYRRFTGSSETHLESRLGATTLLLAGGDSPFGANQFYGPFNSWERTKSWFTGLSQELGANTLLSFGFRRHTDVFELFRTDPAFYTNNHLTDSWQLALRRHNNLGKKLNLFYGAEAFRDSIDSTNYSGAGLTPALGSHARNRGGIYAALEWRPRERLTLSAGAREEYYSGGHGVFTPTISAGYRLTNALRLRGSVASAFRLPTYTDLYYNDPATQGNPNLQPETAWNYEGGVEWTASRRITVSATAFYRHESSDIDYVEVPNGTATTTPLNSIPVPLRCTVPNQAGCFYQARNLNTFSFSGVEASLRLHLTANHEVWLAYTALHGAQQALNGFLSRYLFNYPVNSAAFEWRARLPGAFQLRTRVAAIERYQNDAYALWDLALSRRFRQVRPYLL
ncbi:MAG: TonB-dependent receptor, partial [Candidatus Korobacteraceae bacterium]